MAAARGRDIALAALAMIALWGALWWPVVIAGEVLFHGDIALFALPMKAFALERLAAGVLPHWTPHVSGGMPFLADAANQVFYPGNLLLAGFKDLATAVSWVQALHHLAGVVAFATLARCLGLGMVASAWGGCVFGASGYFLSLAGNVNYLPAIVWLPAGAAAFAHGVRRSSRAGLAGAAACLTLLVLAGDAADAVGLAVLMAGLALSLPADPDAPMPGMRPGARLRACAVVVVLGILTAAVQVLPTLALAARSVRAQGLDYSTVAAWSLPPQRLVELIHPLFFGRNHPQPEFLASALYPTMQGPWAESLYLGLVPLALAVVGARWRWRATWPWLVVGLVALAMALGRHLPGHEILVAWVPGLDTQRYPERWFAYLALGLCVAAAVGADVLAGRVQREPDCVPSGAPGPWLRFGAPVVAMLVLWLTLDPAAAAWLGDRARFPSAWWSMRIGAEISHLQGLLVHAVAVVVAIGVAAALAASRPGAALALLLGFAVADLAWVHQRSAPSAAQALLSAPTGPLLATIPRGPGTRVYFDPFVPAFAYQGVAERVAWVRERVGPRAAHGVAAAFATRWRIERLANNAGAVHGVRYLNGRSSPLQPRVDLEYEERLMAASPHRMLASAGVTHVLTTLSPRLGAWDGAGFRESHVDPSLNLRVIEVRGSASHATVHARVGAIHPDPIGSLAAAAPEGGGPVLMPPVAPMVDPVAVGAHAVRLDGADPARLAIELEAGSPPGWLVVLESAAPGWRARLDGVPVAIRIANGRFSAVRVPGGPARVELHYRTPWLVQGAALSAVGLVLLALLAAGRGPAAVAAGIRGPVADPGGD